DVRIYARPAVVDQHKGQDCDHTYDGSAYAFADRIGAQRRPNRTLLEILDSRGQRARAQRQSEIFRRLFREPSLNLSLILDGLSNVGHFHDFAIEDYGEAVADVCRSEVVKLSPALTCKNEIDAGLVGVITAARLGTAQIAASHCGRTRNQIPS